MRPHRLLTADHAFPAQEADCIGAHCPCSVLAKRLTITDRVCVALMVLGFLGFVAGAADYLGIF